jgi:uncharacterized membrane protein
LSKIVEQPSTPGPWSLTTRRIVTAGVLAAITIILGVTGLGLPPIPNLSGKATFEHIPAIIGAVLEGPLVGLATAFVFGLVSFFYILPNYWIALARVPIGLTAWLAFAALRRFNRDVAAAVAGVVGALTNTVCDYTPGHFRGHCGCYPACVDSSRSLYCTGTFCSRS